MVSVQFLGLKKYLKWVYTRYMDVIELSRLQFAVTITFHYLFPPMSIGLGLMIAIMEGIYMWTKKSLYKEMARFWTKIFALFFAMGVATGFVMAFSFGNNWGGFSRFVGDVFGSLLAAEGIFAFFMESGFLGIMLFGWDRVRPAIHYLSTLLVVIGAHFSAVWIIMANSWMQTPAGFKIIGEGSSARAVITNLWDLYFTPSTIDRLIHVLLGCWILGSFLILSVAAYYLLKKRNIDFAKASMKIALYVSSVVLILQLISGDSTAKGVAKNQPAKLAAAEGVFKTQTGTPITAFGYVDMENERVVGLQIPGGLSFLLYENFETPVPGLDQVPRENWPNVQWTFQTYHLMIIMWGVMVMVVFWTLLLWKKGKLESARKSLWICVLSIFAPYLANMAGWFTAEIGRQPWIVWGLMRTEEGISSGITSQQVTGSLIMFITVFTVLLALMLFLLDRKIKQGPDGSNDNEYRNIKMKEGKG